VGVTGREEEGEEEEEEEEEEKEEERRSPFIAIRIEHSFKAKFIRTFVCSGVAFGEYTVRRAVRLRSWKPRSQDIKSQEKAEGTSFVEPEEVSVRGKCSSVPDGQCKLTLDPVRHFCGTVARKTQVIRRSITKRVIESGNTLDMYSGDSRFKSFQ
jgi:hypothetical protein